MTLDRLRTPFLLLAALFFFAAILLEAGSGFLTGRTETAEQIAAVVREQLKDLPPAAQEEAVANISDALAARQQSPGLGLRYLAWLDTIVFYVLAMTVLGLVIPPEIQGKLQAVATVVVSAIALVVSVFMIYAAFGLLVTMIALTTSPFGMAAYMGTWGFFDRGTARMILGAALLLKIGFAVSLVAAQRRYLMHKWFIFLTLVSLVAATVISILHGLLPRPLVSITDAVAAIIVGVLAAVVATVLLIGGVVGVKKLAT